VPALPSSILEPLWVQIAALLPSPQVSHPLGCHRPRIPDRLVFDKLIQVLVFGCGYRRIADHTCSATTLRRRRDEWINAGVAERLRLAVLAAHDRMPGLQLEQLAVDSCITKAPCGGQTAGPSPVDRRKQGLKRSLVTEAGGIPLGAVPAPANRRDDGLLAATLDTLMVVAGLPERPVVHLDAGYDYRTCRQVLAERGWPVRSPPAASRRPSRPASVGRWSAPTRGPTRTASCAGAPNAAGWWSSSGWPWPAPPSCAAGCSAAPGPATAGKAAPAAAHDRLLAQALREPRARQRRSSGLLVLRRLPAWCRFTPNPCHSWRHRGITNLGRSYLSNP
jgi:transposase